MVQQRQHFRRTLCSTWAGNGGNSCSVHNHLSTAAYLVVTYALCSSRCLHWLGLLVTLTGHVVWVHCVVRCRVLYFQLCFVCNESAAIVCFNVAIDVNKCNLVVGSIGLYQYRPKCLSDWKEIINSTKYTTQLCIAYLSSCDSAVRRDF